MKPAALAVLAALAMPLAFLVPALGQTVEANVEQPRSFGHSVGDLLVQRIDLGIGDAALVPAELPRIGRVNSSLWRRRSEVQVDAQRRHWLSVEYQLINTPQGLTVWYLPPMAIKAANGTLTLAVRSAPFSVGPFTPPQAFEQAALPVMQADPVAAPLDLAPLAARLRLAAAGLLATLLAWGAATAWRHLRRGRHLPFALAMRSLAGEPAQLHLRLHHALNATAGRVMRPDTLPALFERAPHLAPEQGGIEAFLQASRAHFFGGQAAPDEATVLALMRRLHRLERRHAR